jgi:hypothetical protein
VESLLHDPANYSTYPTQWHNLLQHLALSHTLIVLHMRNLPAKCFPNESLTSIDEDMQLPESVSRLSLFTTDLRSRVEDSDAGSIAPEKMPRQERVIEIIMPEPLAVTAARPDSIEPPSDISRRRGSIASIASTSFSFGRRRASSVATQADQIDLPISAHMANSGKAALPPVAFPAAKRYAFTRHGGVVEARSRASSESGRPRSIFSVQSTTSFAPSYRRGGPLAASASSARPRASFASRDRSSIYGGSASAPDRRSRERSSTSKAEPAFDRPLPYIPGRAPVLRVFVPLSDKVRRWPSVEGALATAQELDKSGSSRRLRLGDLIVNTAIQHPKTTEHVLMFVPFVKHRFVPLDYTHSSAGHSPRYVNAFALSPFYFHPFLASRVIYLELEPYSSQISRSLRLAHDRQDLVVSSGARLSAKRYLYVAGFTVQPGASIAPGWEGTVSLEAEGTAEGKVAIEARARGGLGAWEVIPDKSMTGMVWLRLLREEAADSDR